MGVAHINGQRLDVAPAPITAATIGDGGGTGHEQTHASIKERLALRNVPVRRFV